MRPEGRATNGHDPPAPRRLVISYLDAAFCTQACLNSKCYRCVTPYHRERAKEIGLPFSLMDFKTDDCGYIPTDTPLVPALKCGAAALSDDEHPPDFCDIYESGEGGKCTDKCRLQAADPKGTEDADDE